MKKHILWVCYHLLVILIYQIVEQIGASRANVQWEGFSDSKSTVFDSGVDFNGYDMAKMLQSTLKIEGSSYMVHFADMILPNTICVIFKEQKKFWIGWNSNWQNGGKAYFYSTLLIKDWKRKKWKIFQTPSHEVLGIEI